MNISNLEDTRSRRDYNRYQIEYKSVFEIGEISISSFVLVETSFTAVSFPTVMMAVTNYIGGVMEEEAPEMIGEYHIEPFEMKVQGLDRTLADKVFAICDYYMQNRIKKHSRHIYDIYKLLPLVEIPALLQLITEQEIAVEYVAENMV